MEKIKKRLGLLACICLSLILACEEEVLFDFDEHLAIELAEIDNFLSRNGIATETLENHARLNVVAEGNGIIPQDFDTVRYLFSIYDLDSTLLISNREEFSSIANQFWFISDTASFVAYPGWSEQTLLGFGFLGVSLSQEQSLIQLFMPSYLIQNTLGIPADTPVMMDFEVVEILR
ncbi:hypothetical protein [Roseivirga sp. E12]|uniref:hypothetical protein n=1 Tax=Roseivirga sp. E12 TaxID=2819237 RepID=UPI001ABD484C|nr:hypothetical protein [Roseivirga sp. E12]MBO3700384.1 hypothetical protein [Roseivirga sp. E12]